MVITLLTDFGLRDAYAGIMKGVMLGICPGAQLVDLTHEVPAQNVTVGALLLRSAVEYFPPGTVHLAVVDPGVGSARRAIAVVSERALLVGPDNGLLAPAAELLGVREIRHIAAERFFRKPVSHTFHGRDVFAPAAAHLASGIAPAELGPRLDSMQPLAHAEAVAENDGIRGEVIHVDRFGNLITNIPAPRVHAFPSGGVSVSIGGVLISSLVTSYAAVPPGAALAIIGSWGLLEIAVRDRSAAAQLRAGVGTPVSVHPAR